MKWTGKITAALAACALTVSAVPPFALQAAAEKVRTIEIMKTAEPALADDMVSADATWYTSPAGNRFYFDKNGNKVTGWQMIDGKRYYFRPSGVMQTMWAIIDGNKYYFGKTGVMQTMWAMIDGNRYYFGKTGVMRTMWETIGGKKYYFGKTGVMRTMWETIGGKKYYFGKTGVMRTMWETIGGKKYYFGKTGVMRTMWETIGGDKYYFGKTGVMRTGFEVIGGKKYYFGKYGSMARNGIYGDFEYMIDNRGICYAFPKPNTGNHTNDARTIASFIASHIAPGSDLDRIGEAAFIVALFCGDCTYMTSGPNYSQAYGVFIAKEYSCAGATRALGMILDCMGYRWTHANENQWTHQWCIVNMDGKVGYADGMAGWADYGTHPLA